MKETQKHKINKIKITYKMCVLIHTKKQKINNNYIREKDKE